MICGYLGKGRGLWVLACGLGNDMWLFGKGRGLMGACMWIGQYVVIWEREGSQGRGMAYLMRVDWLSEKENMKSLGNRLTFSSVCQEVTPNWPVSLCWVYDCSSRDQLRRTRGEMEGNLVHLIHLFAVHLSMEELHRKEFQSDKSSREPNPPLSAMSLHK